MHTKAHASGTNRKLWDGFGRGRNSHPSDAKGANLPY